MWPFKKFIEFNSTLYREGDAEFEFKILPNTISELDLVSFVINVFSRSHSLAPKSTLKFHNDLIERIILGYELYGFEEMKNHILKTEQDSFAKYSHNMPSSIEKYHYTLKGIYISSTYLHSKIPYLSKPTNWYFIYANLLKYFSKNTGEESKELLINVFNSLHKNNAFKERRYSITKYFDIPNKTINDILNKY